MSSSSANTVSDSIFEDLDDQKVFDSIESKVWTASTQNFVVEFGKEHAQIAYDLSSETFGRVLGQTRVAERPVRWINIWGPDSQKELITTIEKAYGFSQRLTEIIKSTPPASRKPRRYNRSDSGMRRRLQQREDIELGVRGESTPPEGTIRVSKPRADATHYGIAQQMLHYHSVDSGRRFLCIGANWIHELSKKTEETDISEGNRVALWSWLILCDDHTVISIHQDPVTHKDSNDLKSIRGNTFSVLTQLSSRGQASADPISIQTVRQALKSDHDEITVHGDPGIEGASCLFYYLFDDWRAVYSTVANFQVRLDELEGVILDTRDLKSSTSPVPTTQIIPRLHKLGRQFRQMAHLYEGYKNLITAVLSQKTPADHGRTTPRSFSGLSTHHQGVTLAPSAESRFIRLRDRIELMILSELKEFLAEKNALVDTYFNITAQKDSEATARLTRAATLLAKLSVLFLPVSLMTAYFSIQIKELDGVYTTKDYWYSFAVIMTISVLGLFFFAKALMWVTETLDKKMKLVWKGCRKVVLGKGKKKKKKTADEDDDSS